jgi:chromosome segregation ATPase
VVKVIAGSAELNSIESIFNSKSLINKAIEDIQEEELDASQVEAGMHITTKSNSWPYFLNGSLFVEVKNYTKEKPVALELMNAMVKQLEATMSNAWIQENQLNEESLLQSQNKRDDIDRELTELMNVQIQYQKDAGRVIRNRSEILHEKQKMEVQMRDLRMELVGLEARREALQRLIAKTTDEIDHKLARDPILSELEQVINEMHKELAELERVMEEEEDEEEENEGEEDEDFKEELEEKLEFLREAIPDVRIRIVERREQIAHHEVGEALGRWTMEMSEISVESAEMEARYHFLERELSTFQDENLLVLAEAIEKKQNEVHQKEKILRDLNDQITRLEYLLHYSQRPQVIVLGG